MTQGPIGAELLKKLEPKGIIGLAYWDNGFKVMSANKPLKHAGRLQGPEDAHPVIQGARFRDALARRIPQVLAFSEVYQALQTGVVDGTENPPSNLYTQKMHEVQKYMTLSNHGYLGYAVIVNKKFWDGLPADIRTILEGAMKDATTFANDSPRRRTTKRWSAIKKSGKTQIITPDRRRSGGLEKGNDDGAQGDGGRIGKDTDQGSLQGNRLQAD